MALFNDRRGALDRVTGFLRNLGATYDSAMLRQIVTPINPNAPHPLDNPNSALSRSIGRDPYEPNDVQKMYGMNRRDVKKMHKQYDFSTGLPISKKSMRQSRKSGSWGI